MNSKTARSYPAKSPSGAIVLGGNFVGLGVARSLGRHKIPVWVFDSDRTRSIAQFSRYTKRFVVTEEDPHDWLLREGRKRHLDGWVLFPTNDEYVEMVSTNHRSLSSIYRLTTPPQEVTKWALDKRLTYQKAAELGIAAPWTVVSDALAGFSDDDLPYPLILKPASNHRFFPHTNLKALPVDSPADLHHRLAQMGQYLPPGEILVQERIPGGGENQFSFGAVCKNGRAYATLVARRTRQYPVDFGNASTFVETTTQPVVEAAGRRFLEGIGFDGMAEVEFKFDPRDGKYKILDVNSRAWGWHTLGSAAGVDFAYLLWQQACGAEVSAISTRHKAAWLREITDLLAIAKSPHRAAEIKRLVTAVCSGHLTLAAFDLLDPVPFFAECALWAVHGVTRQQKAKRLQRIPCPSPKQS